MGRAVAAATVPLSHPRSSDPFNVPFNLIR
jgi:hypothetical protein